MKKKWNDFKKYYNIIITFFRELFYRVVLSCVSNGANLLLSSVIADILKAWSGDTAVDYFWAFIIFAMQLIADNNDNAIC